MVRSSARPRLSDLPRIAFISEHDDPLAEPGGIGKGGQNVYVREVARRLATYGWHVDVFTRRESIDTPTIEHFGPAARVIRITAGPPACVPKEELPRYLPEFKHNLLAACGPGAAYQLVHGHYYLSGVLARELQQIRGIPFVQTFHSLGAIKRRALGTRDHSPAERLHLERDVADAADCIVATSPQEHADLVELYGAAPEKIRIIPCGVDMQRFRPVAQADARMDWGFRPDTFLITFVGRVEPQKGVEVLIQAAARLRALAPDLPFQIAIVGGMPRKRLASNCWGPTEDRYVLELEALARSLGVAEHIIWTGALPHDSLSSIYSAADVVVIPSHYESFGMTALEALACGACVVASRTGGLRTTLDEGRAGVLFTPGASDELAASFAHLAANPAERAAFQAGARAYVTRTYGWDRIAERLAALYSELTNSRRVELGNRLGIAVARITGWSEPLSGQSV